VWLLRATCSAVCRLRYELSLTPPTPASTSTARAPLFKFARCKRALTEELHTRHGSPLPADLVVVLLEDLTWEALSVRRCARHCICRRWLTCSVVNMAHN
jgi:hypothetical protein